LSLIKPWVDLYKTECYWNVNDTCVIPGLEQVYEELNVIGNKNEGVYL